MQGSSSSVTAQADLLVSARRFREAYGVLTSFRAAQDADAQFTLAIWRLSGDIIRRDLSKAREHFARAARLGHRDAAIVHVNFVANGTGGTADWQAAVGLLEGMARSDEWARGQLEIIKGMRITPAGEPIDLPEQVGLSDRPWVRTFQGLFTEVECAFLVREALPFLEPSLVLDPGTGQHVPNPVRTSDGMAFPFVQESPAVHALNRRIAAITSTDVRHGEPLQVLRYRPGQQYRPHVDAVGGTDNQRVLTVLVYLNSDYEGGETEFVRTGLRFKGQTGDALVFRNTLTDGRPDELVQHAGRPVGKGEKLIASRWIRERPFLVPPPAPLLPD